MKQFYTIEEAREFFKKDFTSKYASELIKVGDDKVWMMCTDLVYEDFLWNGINDMFMWMHEVVFREKVDFDRYCDDSSELRDEVLGKFLKENGITMATVYDEY